MKFVTWNVDFKLDPYQSMKYLEDEIQTDVALIQELPNPEGYKLNGKFLWGRVPKSFNWGSAVYSRKTELQDLGFGEIYPEHRGRVVFARIPQESGNFLYLASIHCPPKSEKFGNFVVPILKDIFKKLLGLYAEQSNKGDYLVIGGDLNASRNFDKHYDQPEETRHTPFFAWLETEMNLVDAHWLFNKREVKTIRTQHGKFDYQDDHIFVSKNLKYKLSSCEVLDNTEIKKLSDHNPVVTELNI